MGILRVLEPAYMIEAVWNVPAHRIARCCALDQSFLYGRSLDTDGIGADDLDAFCILIASFRKCSSLHLFSRIKNIPDGENPVQSRMCAEILHLLLFSRMSNYASNVRTGYNAEYAHLCWCHGGAPERESA